jgi:hypothetical protein
MMTKPIFIRRLASTRGLFAELLFLGLACACGKPASDPKGDLVASLQGADVKGYLFALREDEAQTTSSLTNRAAHHPITLGKGDAELVLRYTRIEDKGAKTTKTYRSAVEKKGSSLELVVTDLGTPRTAVRNLLTDAGPGCQPPGSFDTLDACISSLELDCSRGGALQCAANRTCESQMAALTCCLRNGQVFSVHLIISPTALHCRARDLVPDGGVATQG